MFVPLFVFFVICCFSVLYFAVFNVFVFNTSSFLVFSFCFFNFNFYLKKKFFFEFFLSYSIQTSAPIFLREIYLFQIIFFVEIKKKFFN